MRVHFRALWRGAEGMVARAAASEAAALVGPILA